MVRQRSRLIALSAGMLLTISALAFSQSPAKPAESTPAPVTAISKKVEPIDRLPYRIRVIFVMEKEARLDALKITALKNEWRALVSRFVGDPWVIDIANDSPVGPLAGDIESLTAEPFERESAGFDKVWLIRISAEESGLVYTGREFDAATSRLGPLQRRDVPIVRDAPRQLFLFTRELFSPYAEIGEKFAKNVALRVQGASLAPATSYGSVVEKGTVFQPIRIVPQKSGRPIVREIPYTYLSVEAAEGSGARCGFVSMFSDPLSQAFLQKIKLVALGVKPGKSATKLRFQTLPDRAPAAGYVLTARAYPEGNPREVGTTDREGRVTFEPGPNDGLLVFRLLAGTAEPMREFPLMPGDGTDERTIPAFDPKPLAVTLETRLDSLRDTVIDLVAIRARLLGRLKARFDGEDWTGAEEVLKEYRTLTPREQLADELAKLKDEAARTQAKTKSPILTKTAQAQLTELQSLIERYLDDEAFTGFSEGLEKLKTTPADAAKAKSEARKKQPEAPSSPKPEAPKPATGPF